ncbi:hypothetical protein IJT17_09120 [bacterium]|nr:hypothetical protein [bacterium]
MSISVSRYAKGLAWGLTILLLLPLAAEDYLMFKGAEKADVALERQRFAEYSRDPVMKALGWDNDPQSVRYTLAVKSPVPADFKRLGLKKANYLVLGCSCTYGIAIRDDEGFVSLLKQRLNWANFDNYAVPGYGTYQLYRKLQLIFERNHNQYDAVIYCNINDHLRRNTWLNMARDGQGLRFIIPRVVPLDDGSYRYTDIEPVPYWPITSLFGRFGWFAQTVYIREFSHKPFPRSVDVAAFNDLLSRMSALCESHGTKLYTVWLDRDISPELSEGNAQRIRCIDAVFNDIENPRYQVPGDGHPNAEVNRFWADKIEAGLTR